MKQWFSQRIGEEEVREELQIESIDEETRNRLWNRLNQIVNQIREQYHEINFDHKKGTVLLEITIEEFWDKFLKQPVDELSNHQGTKIEEGLGKFKEIILRDEWHRVLSLMEFLDQSLISQMFEEFPEVVNSLFKEEKVGYSLIEGEICQITDENEIEEIEEAVNQSVGRFDGAKEHLKNALHKLSDRENPDYRNSIKESILAVESMAQILTGDEDATLGQALNVLQEDTDLHQALSNSFSSMYGWTSDDEGIRHAMQEIPDLDFEDAKFMLVVCSAFVNYLIEKKHKIES